MNIGKFLNSNKIRWKYIVFVLLVLIAVLLRIAGPYIIVPNSIPGQVQLSDQQRHELLSNTAERTLQVDEQRKIDVLSSFANQSTEGRSHNERGDVVPLARIILANLSLNQNVDDCNQLLKKLVVWGRSGSTWQFHKTGDYDFAAIWMTTILYEFGENEDVLYPDSKQYLLNVLLPDQGKLNSKVPRTLGLVFDTENHLLMREGSRYLKNQWLTSHGNTSTRFDNDQNGMTQWLESYLNHIRLHGPYEYNAVPYLSYTMLPLMNLAEYAESETIRKLAESILDDIFYRYAYGSFDLRQCTSFRRRFEHAEDQGLYLNRCHYLIRFWQDGKIKNSDQLVLASVIHGYTLPQSTFELFEQRPDAEYFKVFNHDQKGSPEIYSGGPNFLLSAGGAYRGELAKVISRPITLLLDDDAKELKDCIHIQGKGPWQSWNMTGVHRRFAVAKGMIFIPEKFNYNPKQGWNVVVPNEDITVAFYQGQKLALLLVLPEVNLHPEDIIKLLVDNNPSLEQTKTFNWPREFASLDTFSVQFDIDTTT